MRLLGWRVAWVTNPSRTDNPSPRMNMMMTRKALEEEKVGRKLSPKEDESEDSYGGPIHQIKYGSVLNYLEAK